MKDCIEDVDLSFRAQSVDNNCPNIPIAIVYHKVGGTSGTENDFTLYYGQRNIECVYFENAPIKIFTVNPVRNSSGALNPAGIIIKPNPAAEQRGIISNGVNLSKPFSYSSKGKGELIYGGIDYSGYS